VTNRREFVRYAAGAALGLLAGDRAVARAFTAVQTPAARREIVIGGRRIRTVDIHAHCVVPEVTDIIRGTPLAATMKDALGSRARALNPERLRAMDQQGIDIQALSINAFWYALPREQARDLVTLQNERMAQWCTAHPDRFVALASVALQHPDLAAQQLDEAVRNSTCAGRHRRER